MSASIQYFLTTKTHCSKCDGRGSVSVETVTAFGIGGLLNCSECDGKGFILGEQEVELTQFGGTTGFSKVVHAIDED